MISESGARAPGLRLEVGGQAGYGIWPLVLGRPVDRPYA